MTPSWGRVGDLGLAPSTNSGGGMGLVSSRCWRSVGLVPPGAGGAVRALPSTGAEGEAWALPLRELETRRGLVPSWSGRRSVGLIPPGTGGSRNGREGLAPSRNQRRIVVCTLSWSWKQRVGLVPSRGLWDDEDLAPFWRGRGGVSLGPPGGGVKKKEVVGSTPSRSRRSEKVRA